MAACIDYSQLLPVFPLPNVVLLPKAVVPLHVFEPRYRDMTRDALATHRLIALALLKPGFEPKYQSLNVPIHRHVCVGRIVKSEHLEDGRYNILVEGVDRAEVVAECTKRTYRRAQLTRVAPVVPDVCRESELYGRLRELVTSDTLRDIACRANWHRLFECSGMTLSHAADLLAHSILPTPEDKLRFLAEPCVTARASCIAKVLESISAQLSCEANKRPKRSWPPPCSDN